MIWKAIGYAWRALLSRGRLPHMPHFVADSARQFHDVFGTLCVWHCGACIQAGRAKVRRRDLSGVHKKGRARRPSVSVFWCSSALARFETRVAFADHEYLAATTYDFAVAVPLFGRFKRGQNFHGGLPIKS